MPKFGSGFGAWIIVGKNRLPVYRKRFRQDSKSTRRTCYIVSKTGQRFRVRWKVPSGDAAYFVSLFIDGNMVDNCVSCADEGNRTDVFTGMWIDGKTKAPFMFSSPTFISEEESTLRVDNNTPAEAVFGTIHVEMVEVKECRVDGDFERIEVAKYMRSVPERKAHLLTHTVGSVPNEHFNTNIEECYFEEYEEPKHIVSFSFSYRSKDYLRAAGILPSQKSQRQTSPLLLTRKEFEPADRVPRIDNEAERQPGSSSQQTNSVSSDSNALLLRLTEAEIKERKARIAREKAVLEEKERMLDAAQDRLLRLSNPPERKPCIPIDIAEIRKQLNRNIEIIDLTDEDEDE